MIKFYISQNIAALLKTFRVIFRHLRLFFVPKSSLQDYKWEASWKARVLGLLWTASASWRGGRVCPSPWSPSRAVAPAAGMLAGQAPHVSGTWHGTAAVRGVWRGSPGAPYHMYLCDSPTGWVVLWDGELLLPPSLKEAVWKHPDLIFWGFFADLFSLRSTLMLCWKEQCLSWGLACICRGCACSLCSSSE